MATASRPETISWVEDLGAHHVIDHGKPIAAQVAALGIGAPFAPFALGCFLAQRPPLQDSVVKKSFLCLPYPRHIFKR